MPDADQAALAAIDLGSNSFHMVVARSWQNELRVQEALSEKVQLGAGLDDGHRLGEEAQQRALECLRRFAQRVAGLPPENVRIVGTNTLRVARNASEFIRRASEVLDHDIEVVAGREEARLIWLGVSHSLPEASGRRLVVDIGGGSTEFIVGEGFEALGTESLHMGCVTWTERFFPDGAITGKRLERAITAARQEVLSIEADFRRLGWQEAVGASGTIRTVAEVCREQGWCEDGVSRTGLEQIHDGLIAAGHLDQVRFTGLPDDRRSIFTAGVAILLGVFRQLGLEHMTVSSGALREGILYDLVGRSSNEDVRERTTRAMMARYHVDVEQAERVANLAMAFHRQVAATWKLDQESDAMLLRRAGLLHEVGFSVSHTQFHKHGAYLIRHGDMAGFSKQEQHAVAFLVRGHRRKIPLAMLEEFAERERDEMLRLCLLLRIAARLHHARSGEALPDVRLDAGSDALVVHFPAGWLDAHPLTRADLESEQEYFSTAGYRLDWTCLAPANTKPL